MTPAGGRPPSPAAELSVAEGMRRLALVDELIGTRSELAEVRVGFEHSIAQTAAEMDRLRRVVAALELELADARTRIQAAESAEGVQRERAERAEQAVLTRSDELVAEFRSSSTWRIGRSVTAPVRAARRLLRRAR